MKELVCYGCVLMLQAWQSDVACHEAVINLGFLSLTCKNAERLFVTELACVSYLSVLVVAIKDLLTGHSHSICPEE